MFVKFSKSQIVIKYDISGDCSSICAHLFEHILVSSIENDEWFKEKGAMVYGATCFDYIEIEINMLKVSKRILKRKLLEKIFCIDENLECKFNNQHQVLLRESCFYEETDEEKIILSMLKKSLKVKNLNVQGSHKDISNITFEIYKNFIQLNILKENIILRIDGKDYFKKNENKISISNIDVVSCQIMKSEDLCTICLIVPDTTNGQNKTEMELFEYLNFSAGNGLYEILREQRKLIYNLEHAYVFIQGIYMLVVTIKCEKDVFNEVMDETQKYVDNKLFKNNNFQPVLNPIMVLKHCEYKHCEKQICNLYHKLLTKENMTLTKECKSLKSINHSKFQKFLEMQTIYIGISK